MIVVTGASAGIGEAAAVELAARGATVVPVGRDEGRLRRVAQRIGADEPGGYERADFTSLDDVRALAARLLDRHPRIHVLVNNAGAVFGRRERSSDGHELTFQVNHLAPFLLTSLLRERLGESAPARVVTTSSASPLGRAHRPRRPRAGALVVELARLLQLEARQRPLHARAGAAPRGQ